MQPGLTEPNFVFPDSQLMFHREIEILARQSLSSYLVHPCNSCLIWESHRVADTSRHRSLASTASQSQSML
jgi:hypothetical protein